MTSTIKIDREIGLRVLTNFKAHLEVRKNEIKGRFKVVHRVLEEHEYQLLKQLDDCYDTISQKLILVTPKPCEKQVNSFRRFKSPKIDRTPAKESVIALEDSKVSKLKIPFYEIEWDLKRIKSLTKETCLITEINNGYATRFSAENFEGNKNLVANINHPEGVAVSISDLKIYVADYGNNRILVADQNTNQINQEITAEEIKWPQYLCVNEEFLFVSCNENNHLVKVDRFKGHVTASVDTKQLISGVALDGKDKLYSCEANKRVITVRRTRDLESIRSFRLNSSYVWPYTTTWDISIQEEKLYVLFENTPFPVQVFDLEGSLLSKLIGEDRLEQSCHLNLDSNGNIAVSEYQMGRIKVFTNKGELMHSVRGLEFPTGVGFGSAGRIVFCNNQGLSLL